MNELGLLLSNLHRNLYEFRLLFVFSDQQVKPGRINFLLFHFYRVTYFNSNSKQ